MLQVVLKGDVLMRLGKSSLEIYLNRQWSVYVESSPVYFSLVFPLNRTFVMVNLWLSSLLYSLKESVSGVQLKN